MTILLLVISERVSNEELSDGLVIDEDVAQDLDVHLRRLVQEGVPLGGRVCFLFDKPDI